MFDYLVGLDSEVFLWLHSPHTPFWDYFMLAVTGKVIWGGMYIAILYALWRTYGLKIALIVLIATALAVLFSDQLTASFIRPSIARLRPSHPENPISDYVNLVNGYRGGPYGFPSSHASNTFAVATLLSLVFRNIRFTVAIFIWALINCYSRVYLGVHYPGDLIVGAIIGFIIGLFLYLIIAVFSGKKFPGSISARNGVFIKKGRWYNPEIKVYPSDLVILVELMTLICVIFGYLLS